MSRKQLDAPLHDDDIIAWRLRELRNEKGLSMRQVSEMIGIAYSSVVQYERGIREPGRKTLEKLAALYNVDVDYIIGVSNTKNIKNVKAMTSHIKEYEKFLIEQYRHTDSKTKQIINEVFDSGKEKEESHGTNES